MTPDMRRRLNLFLLIFFGIMVLGTVGFMAVEKKSVVDAAYFVIVTMATVGYGDIHPLTDGGKIFTILLIVLGVGAFLGVIANITDIILARREGERRVQKLNMVIGVFFSEVGIGLCLRKLGSSFLFSRVSSFPALQRAAWCRAREISSFKSSGSSSPGESRTRPSVMPLFSRSASGIAEWDILEG